MAWWIRSGWLAKGLPSRDVPSMGLISVFLLALLSSNPSFGQGASSIVLDGSLPGTQVEALSGPDYQITADKGARAGSNLFFSFSRFGLETGESATFSGPDSVSRILSRVTGSEISSIDGLLRSEIDGASLYLINPNGIVLGENASLDLSGAFHATTADFLEFEDGAEFHARFPERDSPLSMEPVSAFGFLSADPASITVDGSQLISGELSLVGFNVWRATGQPFSLIGGDIEILGGDGSGYLFTGGSRLDIASLDSPGRVRIVNEDPGDPGSSGDLVVESDGVHPLSLGDVRIAEGAALVTGGPPPVQSFTATFVEGSGDVFIRANDLSVEDAEIRSITTTDRAGGRIDVDLTGDFVADGLGLNRTTGLVAGSGHIVDVQDPSVPTPRIEIIEITSPFTAEIQVFKDSNGRVVRYEHVAEGTGGAIEIEAENVSLLNGAKLSSSGIFGGDGGAIAVAARDAVTIAGTRQDGIVGGIFSNAQAGGDSGSITVTAESLTLDEFGGLFGEVSGGAGLGGSIDVDVARLRINGSGRIDTTTRGAGPGGLITIDATEWVHLSGRADDFNFSSVTTFSLEEGSGPAGTLIIQSPEITLADGAGISTSALGEGDGGVVDLRADVIELRSSSITSLADRGTAGDIYINGGPLVEGSFEIQKPPGVEGGERLVLDRSEISTSATEGFGRGGDIIIDPQFVVLGDSEITARAVGGEGGNIVIVAEQLVSDLDTVINADSELSSNGHVVIATSGQELRGDASVLPSTIPDVVELLRERCSARRSGAAAASFVLRGRDGLPYSPDDYLPARHDLEATDPERLAKISDLDSEDPIELILGCRAFEG